MYYIAIYTYLEDSASLFVIQTVIKLIWFSTLVTFLPIIKDSAFLCSNVDEKQFVTVRKLIIWSQYDHQLQSQSNLIMNYKIELLYKDKYNLYI